VLLWHQHVFAIDGQTYSFLSLGSQTATIKQARDNYRGKYDSAEGPLNS
jgi:hypothetical protein